MIKEAIDKILSLGESKEQTINERTYANGPNGIVPIKPPKAETLTINTLTGIVDYGVPPRHMIHVVDNKCVNVIDDTFSDLWLTRSTYLTAIHESPVFKFGQWFDNESFIIAIQSLFVQDENTAAILKIVGNIKEEAVNQFNDDGVTQAVTVKQGITRVELSPVPNPVTLRPYRTFMEIEQPASTFVLRMQAGKGSAPSCALFEADGRMWRLEAIKSIKVWLTENIHGVKIIA
jgi:hypothetical protein